MSTQTFYQLYDLYKDKLTAEPAPAENLDFPLANTRVLDMTAILQMSGNEGIDLMLTQLYASPPNFGDITEKDYVPNPNGGLSPLACELGSRLLGREVTQHDPLILQKILAVRVEMPAAQFDELTRIINSGHPSGLAVSDQSVSLVIPHLSNHSPAKTALNHTPLTSAIQEFMAMGCELVMTVHQHRYGGEMIALITSTRAVENVVDSIEDKNGEQEWELWGLMNAWYPVAFGANIGEAVKNLEERLDKYRADWKAIHFGMERISNAPRGSYLCAVRTTDDLYRAMDAWNTGKDEITFF